MSVVSAFQVDLKGIVLHLEVKVGFAVWTTYNIILGAYLSSKLWLVVFLRLEVFSFITVLCLMFFGLLWAWIHVQVIILSFWVCSHGSFSSSCKCIVNPWMWWIMKSNVSNSCWVLNSLAHNICSLSTFDPWLKWVILHSLVQRKTKVSLISLGHIRQFVLCIVSVIDESQPQRWCKICFTLWTVEHSNSQTCCCENDPCNEYTWYSNNVNKSISLVLNGIHKRSLSSSHWFSVLAFNL